MEKGISKGMKKKIFWGSIVFIVLLSSLLGFTTLFKSEGSLDLKKFRIGYINRDTLTALKDQQLLENQLKKEGISVEWIEFQDEVRLYQALEQGNLDFGKVGDAVPAFLHKGKNSPIYFAAEPPNPNARAIAVSKGSKIKGVKDLIGKKVAYTKFSNEHYFLLQLLVKNGLGTEAIEDFESIEATSSEGMELLQKGEVDAAVVSEPYVSQLKSSQYPLIFDGELPANADIYLTTKENVKERKETLNTVLQVIYEYDDFLTNDIHLAAEFLYQSTNILHAVWMAVFENEAYGISPFFEGMIAEQQKKVDFLYEQKVIEHHYNVADYVVKLDE
jgi:sulfonate transport system substrate-binding protein